MAQEVARGYDGLSHHRVLKLDNGQYVTEYSTDLQNWSEGEPQERHEKRNAAVVPGVVVGPPVPPIAPHSSVDGFHQMLLAAPPHWIYAITGFGAFVILLITVLVFLLLHGVV